MLNNKNYLKIMDKHTYFINFKWQTELKFEITCLLFTYTKYKENK